MNTPDLKIKLAFKDGIHSLKGHHMKLTDSEQQYICFDFDEFIKMVAAHGDCFDYTESTAVDSHCPDHITG